MSVSKPYAEPHQVSHVVSGALADLVLIVSPLRVEAKSLNQAAMRRINPKTTRMIQVSLLEILSMGSSPNDMVGTNPANVGHQSNNNWNADNENNNSDNSKHQGNN